MQHDPDDKGGKKEAKIQRKLHADVGKVLASITKWWEQQRGNRLKEIKRRDMNNNNNQRGLSW